MCNTEINIRQYYEELKNMMSELPSLNYAFKTGYVIQPEITSHYNYIVCELVRITKENFDRFSFPSETQSSDGSHDFESLSVLRVKLNSLIGYLYGKFFKDVQRNSLDSTPVIHTSPAYF